MESKEKNACAVCGKPATAQCSRCKAIHYCSRDCQKQHWPEHKKSCGKQKAAQQETQKSENQMKIDKLSNSMIDKDNLKMSESIGTFRWNDSMELLPAPEWKEEFSGMLP